MTAKATSAKRLTNINDSVRLSWKKSYHSLQSCVYVNTKTCCELFIYVAFVSCKLYIKYNFIASILPSMLVVRLT
jgi:hypothetical protein